MNVKRTAIGFAATLALTLGLTTGALAADDLPAGSSSATLVDGPCDLSVTGSSDADFGTWVYDETLNSDAGGWKPSGTGTDSVVITVGETASTDRQADCSVGVAATDLTVSPATSGIPVTLTWTGGNSTSAGATNDAEITVTVAPSGTANITVSIDNPLPNALTDNNYGGTITLTDALAG